MNARALSFGTVAAAYERYRPGYPDLLVEEVLTYAGRPVGAALEIGAGTGKATRTFAARGIVVTATDPDPAMLEELRRHVPATVSTTLGAFEDLPLTATYDLVFAAASMHWTDPAGRWPRVASLLGDGGVFASFGAQLDLAEAGLEDAVRAVRSPVLDADTIPSPDGTPPDSAMQWPGTELLGSPHFTDVRQVTIERRFEVSAADYLGHLSTVSAYLQLPADVRRDLFDRILAVLPPQVTLDGDLTLHLARTRDPAVVDEPE